MLRRVALEPVFRKVTGVDAAPILGIAQASQMMKQHTGKVLGLERLRYYGIRVAPFKLEGPFEGASESA
jgi:hypothetical protein